MVGVAEPTVSRWESTKFNPDRMTMVKLTEVLCVRSDYLDGKDVPELNDYTAEQVLRRESLRLFLESLGLSESRRASHRYWKGVDLPDAPLTVDGWKNRHAFVHAISGTKP